MTQAKTGFANINGAEIYYEIAGEGIPFVMLHAGVADHRQWNNEFTHFAQKYQVVRYDLRGYGKSEPVDGDFRHMDDLISLLDDLAIHEPVMMMGCSMGGELAMDFALAHPTRVKALIMVSSGPGGLELDVPTPDKFAEAGKAYHAGDWDLLTEIETQIWFDGINREARQVNQEMRALAYEMNLTALIHDARRLGKRLPDAAHPAFEHLKELNVPVLIITGAHDIPYIQAAADYMLEHISGAESVTIEDAAHLPNMDHPQAFCAAVEGFQERHGLF